MKTADLGRYALGFCAAVVAVCVLSGCAGSPSPSMSLAPQIAAPQSAAAGSAPLVGPLDFHCHGLRVHPRRATIQLGQRVAFRVEIGARR